MEDLRLVSYSTGTMNSLVDKLASMKNHSDATEEFCDLTKNFKKDVQDLKVDFCEKLSVPKVCMKQVRELFFEIEDWIDQKPETNMLDPSDKEEIENFVTGIKEARERFTWYSHLLNVMPAEPDFVLVAPSKIGMKPRPLVKQKKCQGLLDGPRDELVKYLTGDKEEMLKVVSIVGMEGLGKTTLANEIYSVLQRHEQFNCRALVSVGRRTPMKEALHKLLRQVKPAGSVISLDEQQVITELREHLDGKRYFIVVDGIWSTWAWKVINCALPNNRGSRVLTTTCIIDVGKSCSRYPTGLVYQMEALSAKNSRTLFLSQIATHQAEEKGTDFEEASGYMLSMCGGMPLAIIVAVGLLLDMESKELAAELKMIGKSIQSSLKLYSTSEGMTKILHMSYADLSVPLRSCFLYLSVFPENYTIKKDRLIWLWEAQGFIPRIYKECVCETGEMYFNELISRRLIQPVFGDHGQTVGCTIHSVIFDFIISLSRGENFVTRAAQLSSGSFPSDTIRRFSLDCSNEDEVVTFTASTVYLSRMRSLSVFPDVEGKLDPRRSPLVYEDDGEVHAPPDIRVPLNIILAFKLMRVLDLEDTNILKDCHLEGIGGLVLLRYLGLAGTGITGLPEEIGALGQLETLDFRRNSGIRTWPEFIDKLKLVHLLHDEHLKVKASSLQTKGLQESIVQITPDGGIIILK